MKHEIHIIKFDSTIIGGERRMRKTHFGAFLDAITNPANGYTNFVSSSNTTKIYREKGYDLIRLEFERLYQFKMLDDGFGVYSYRNGMYWLEMWREMGAGHMSLHRFQYIPIDDFLSFVDSRHEHDNRCEFDAIQQHFSLNN